MKTLIFITINIISITLYSQTVWFPQNSGTTSNLNWVQFLNQNTGYACGSGGVFLKTTNGGMNWVSMNLNQSNLLMLQFMNAQTGFVSGDSGILRTTNGGINFTQVYSGNDGYYIHFTDIDNGIKVNWSVGKTTNGGLNWTNIGSITPGGITSLYYINNGNIYSTGWMWSMHFGGLYTANIFKSTNGGSAWNSQYYSQLDLCCSRTLSISFPDLNNGFATGFERNIYYFYKTANSGANWVKQQIPNNMYSVQFINASSGWLCGEQGRILYTTNSGSVFYSQVTNVTSSLKKIFMINSDTGFAVGDNGTILNTNSGGFTGITYMNNNIPEKFSLSQNYPNPFNPSTKIKFQIPASVETSLGVVLLTIYDVLGKEVQVLINEQLQPGSYEADWNASSYPSGIYYYRIESGNYTETKKMVLVK